jgi:hypothetical protein
VRLSKSNFLTQAWNFDISLTLANISNLCFYIAIIYDCHRQTDRQTGTGIILLHIFSSAFT